MSEGTVLPASFRDPNGFVFRREGRLYRQVNHRYHEHYDFLMHSGLYDALVKEGLLIPHSEESIRYAITEDAYRIIQPVEIPFISYPYEWCFGQLKHAALLLLAVQKRALSLGMSLKDASAYNIQFTNGKPILIDSLSLEKYRAGQPWIAYRQFCQHFLAPLALMTHVDVRMQQLLRVYLDGIPLDLASALLPLSTRLNLGLLSHIHLHAQAQKHLAGTPDILRPGQLGQTAFLGLLENLLSTLENLKWTSNSTPWRDYYTFSNYSAVALDDKRRIVSDMLEQIPPSKMVWDLGGNIGVFSRVACLRSELVACLDADPAAVEQNYQETISKHEKNILPLVCDVTNPSPGLGWENRERMSLQERGPADLVLVLALVHHLAISHNLPFRRIADFLRQIGRFLIIEFVPKDDAGAQKLLAYREDIFEQYNQAAFEREFGRFFRILDQKRIADTDRTLYLMILRDAQ
ncbi:MAG: class I SAM-dependent methyltransferase [Chloroflexi bacterium]|nr:class I SAM-dependent methyltransferase [Chloroflexota bacterium]